MDHPLQCVTIGPLALRSLPRLDTRPVAEFEFGQFSRLLKSHLEAAREGGELGGGGGGTPKPGRQFNRKKIGLKNHLSFGLRLSTLRKCSKMGSLD